jgi:diguanylate cyclase (GGDEF)-like protein/PAS domain S-box-containing protein
MRAASATASTPARSSSSRNRRPESRAPGLQRRALRADDSDIPTPAALTSERPAAVRASEALDGPDPARRPCERLLHLVTDLLGAPVAVVSLLDADRMVVLSSLDQDGHGVPITDRMCRRVADAGAPLIVADVRLRPELGPASIGGAIAYLGVPLRDGAGDALGTLCALEPHPRAWTPTEVGLLEELASVGTAELVLRSTAAAAEQAHHQTAAAIASALDAIVTMDGDGLVTGCNPAAERLFGYARDFAIGRRLTELIIPPDLRPAHEAALAEDVGAGVSRILDRRLERTAMRADGAQFPVELTVTRTDGDGWTTFTCFVRDLSDQRSTERALVNAEARLALAVEGAPIMLFALDLEGRITLSEGSALASIGYEPGAAVGLSAFDLYKDLPDAVHGMGRALAGEAVDATLTVDDVVLETRYRPILDADGVVQGVVGVALDVTERLQDEARIAELAYVDRLTGLPNRTRLELEVARALGAEAHAAGRTAALLFIDLDGFGGVNDSLGHAAGDLVLREAASRLLEVAGPDGFLARQGADEFLLFIDDLGSDPGPTAERVALRAIAALEAPFDTSGLEFHVEASVGISAFPRDGEGFSELLRNAESALRQAKRAPGSHHAVHRRDDAGARRRLTMTARLRRALAAEQFVLHYQPIFDVSSGRLSGAEALLRWEDPEVGRIPPLDFIGVAEATGLILPIGAWVAEAACRQAKAWHAMGLDITVGFNVSPVQLQRTDFPGDLACILERTGVDPAQMVVEITESVAMDAETDTGAVLKRLARLGIAVVIDDFGAGHSSLTRLRQLDISSLKIDRALLEGVPGDAGAVAVVTATLALADALGIPTVAEGVETEDQHEFLRDRGCRWAQGFGLARPMPAPDVTALLALSPVEGSA